MHHDERVIGHASMTQFAYLFERFPSFGQTFCYREVAELVRQGVTPLIFSIRKPKDEPPQDWDQRIVERVHYLPDEEQLPLPRSALGPCVRLHQRWPASAPRLNP